MANLFLRYDPILRWRKPLIRSPGLCVLRRLALWRFIETTTIGWRRESEIYLPMPLTPRRVTPVAEGPAFISASHHLQKPAILLLCELFSVQESQHEAATVLVLVPVLLCLLSVPMAEIMAPGWPTATAQRQQVLFKIDDLRREAIGVAGRGVRLDRDAANRINAALQAVDEEITALAKSHWELGDPNTTLLQKWVALVSSRRDQWLAHRTEVLSTLSLWRIHAVGGHAPLGMRPDSMAA
ncbi:hypothetical protein B0H17DRAFT_1191442 [Mycena rosella]|uniref:Uncharacterized protein n=1 Tax=Mycena rosella TaxID=1033263 RepID=A0AAD7MB97_MYCRO|nr:hypothetical protein B0H17DRAFT_1191442 [Mycena rosella]